jgi:Spy/CpxP family protein refolding chaperone
MKESFLMRKAKVSTIAIAAAASALALAVTSGPSYAWSWGSEDQQNYQFNPQHRDEILQYGSQIGANWSQEIRDTGYASKQPSDTSSSSDSKAYAGDQQTSQKAHN